MPAANSTSATSATETSTRSSPDAELSTFPSAGTCSRAVVLSSHSANVRPRVLSTSRFQARFALANSHRKIRHLDLDRLARFFAKLLKAGLDPGESASPDSFFPPFRPAIAELINSGDGKVCFMKRKTSRTTNSMNRSVRRLILAAGLTFILCVSGQVRPGQPQLLTNSPGLPAYPLKASDNGRYLVDQNGTPTIMVGDSTHP